MGLNLSVLQYRNNCEHSYNGQIVEKHQLEMQELPIVEINMHGKQPASMQRERPSVCYQ